MISLTEAAQSIDLGFLSAIGWLLDNTIIYGLALLVLIFVGEKKKKKQMKIILALGIATVAALLLKEGIAVDRPCFGEGWCPDSYSFPSLHAVAAFTLMTAFIRKRAFPYYLLFALFVAFTRLNIGVHFFQDIVAALPVALVSYYIAWTVVEDE